MWLSWVSLFRLGQWLLLLLSRIWIRSWRNEISRNINLREQFGSQIFREFGKDLRIDTILNEIRVGITECSLSLISWSLRLFLCFFFLLWHMHIIDLLSYFLNLSRRWMFISHKLPMGLFWLKTTNIIETYVWLLNWERGRLVHSKLCKLSNCLRCICYSLNRKRLFRFLNYGY
jgi:hypothetical protein